ncbi:calcitonin/calcitonin-related polypeptide, alpha [Cynoglossus semilaevis]|uniref:Calcitonin related polypeptide beta n=1 Tax=Cynoglossus semilaevis TaxID=244447 RepID=A0A3P8VNF2_CYNSE|nr:calcitonin-1-like [Cynoglossus semilaevis]
MMVLKQWTLLCAYMLIICDMYMSQAAPSRSNKELISNGAVSDTDVEKLLRAMKDFMQMMNDEQDHQSADENSLDRPMSKRCTNLSTCVLGKLSQDIHKLQTFPRTDVGAHTPGRKRSLSEPYGN